MCERRKPLVFQSVRLCILSGGYFCRLAPAVSICVYSLVAISAGWNQQCLYARASQQVGRKRKTLAGQSVTLCILSGQLFLQAVTSGVYARASQQVGRKRKTLASQSASLCILSGGYFCRLRPAVSIRACRPAGGQTGRRSGPPTHCSVFICRTGMEHDQGHREIGAGGEGGGWRWGKEEEEGEGRSVSRSWLCKSFF